MKIITDDGVDERVGKAQGESELILEVELGTVDSDERDLGCDDEFFRENCRHLDQ